VSANGSSRARMLGAIRQSLQSARHLPSPPQVTLPPPGAAPAAPALAEQFAAELTQLSGRCLSLPAAEVAGWLLGLLRERATTEIMAWAASELPVAGLHDALTAGGIRIVDSTVPPQEPARTSALARLETVTLGLTGADAAFADTGTLALASGPGRPRLASLSVRTHVALLDPRRLFPSWGAWLAGDGPQAARRLADASNLALITGPSRTGDIEMTLTVGVHGPGEVFVVLVG